MKYYTNSTFKKILFFALDLVLSLSKKKDRIFPQNVENILIVKPDHLGDMLMLTSIFPFIYNSYPHAKIDIICGEWALHILDNNPYIRNKIIINGFAVNRKKISHLQKILEFWKTFSQARQILKNESYDLCIYMRIHKGNMIPIHWFLASSTFSIGYGTRGRGNLLNKEIILHEEKHEVDTFINICSYMGIKIVKESLQYQLYPYEQDEIYVETILQQNNIQLKEFTIIHMGSGNSEKQLDPKLWNKLLLNYHETLVFTGLDNEIELANQLSIVHTKIIFLFGLLTIQQLYLVMRKASRIVTVESLSAHLAGMTSTPTISYYINNPHWWKPLNAQNVEIKMVKST